jgi:hypothetical protein
MLEDYKIWIVGIEIQGRNRRYKKENQVRQKDTNDHPKLL